jgi:hypothetical protein
VAVRPSLQCAFTMPITCSSSSSSQPGQHPGMRRYAQGTRRHSIYPVACLNMSACTTCTSQHSNFVCKSTGGAGHAANDHTADRRQVSNCDNQQHKTKKHIYTYDIMHRMIHHTLACLNMRAGTTCTSQHTKVACKSTGQARPVADDKLLLVYG